MYCSGRQHRTGIRRIRPGWSRLFQRRDCYRKIASLQILRPEFMEFKQNLKSSRATAFGRHDQPTRNLWFPASRCRPLQSIAVRPVRKGRWHGAAVTEGLSNSNLNIFVCCQPVGRDALIPPRFPRPHAKPVGRDASSRRVSEIPPYEKGTLCALPRLSAGALRRFVQENDAQGLFLCDACKWTRSCL